MFLAIELRINVTTLASYHTIFRAQILGLFFFLTTFFKMSLFQLPLDKSLMRKSQRSSVFGLFVECQINYRKMYRLNLSHVLFFFQLGETTQNLRLYALNPELNLAEVF